MNLNQLVFVFNYYGNVICVNRRFCADCSSSSFKTIQLKPFRLHKRAWNSRLQFPAGDTDFRRTKMANDNNLSMPILRLCSRTWFRFEILAANNKIKAFENVTPCSFVHFYWCFVVSCYLICQFFNPETRPSRFLRNVGSYLRNVTLLQPRNL
jgi:hypothetical protein